MPSRSHLTLTTPPHLTLLWLRCHAHMSTTWAQVCGVVYIITLLPCCVLVYLLFTPTNTLITGPFVYFLTGYDPRPALSFRRLSFVESLLAEFQAQFEHSLRSSICCSCHHHIHCCIRCTRIRCTPVALVAPPCICCIPIWYSLHGCHMTSLSLSLPQFPHLLHYGIFRYRETE